MVEVNAKEAHGNSVIIEENIRMRTSLPPPSFLDLWDSFITLIGNGQNLVVKSFNFAIKGPDRRMSWAET